MARDVVITGVGLISSLGIGLEETWAGVLAGRSGAVAADAVEATFVNCPAVAPVATFRARDYIANRKSLKLMTRPVKLGMAAAHLAWEDSELARGGVEPERLGVWVGAGQAFADRSELEYALKASRDDHGEFDIVAFGEKGIDQIHPLWLLRGLSNNVLGFVSLEYDAQGPNNNYCNSGISSMQAITEGARAVAEGRVDVAFVGGYDSVTGPEALLGYGRLGLLATGDAEPAAAHRPFDRHRRGMVPAEGAAFLIIEAADRAQLRGASAYARLAGGGVASDGFAVADADPKGGEIVRALTAAIRASGLGPSDIAGIFAHGAASTFDSVEATAYKTVFGERASEVLVTADKAAIGHCVAAAGGISVGLAAMAVREGVAPPINNLDDVNADCAGLRYVIGEPAPIDGAVAVISAGMGGQGAAVILDAAR